MEPLHFAKLCSLPETNRGSSRVTEPGELTCRYRYGSNQRLCAQPFGLSNVFLDVVYSDIDHRVVRRLVAQCVEVARQSRTLDHLGRTVQDLPAE